MPDNNNRLDTEVVVPLKNLSDLPLINCKIELRFDMMKTLCKF